MGQAKEKKDIYTYEEYLVLEQQDQIRYEFFHGEVFAMAGGTKDHNRIANNMHHYVDNLLSDSCDIFTGDVKIEINHLLHYIYPDVVLTCDPKDLKDGKDHKILYPALIIEVLSKSTRGYDQDEKKAAYMRLPSLLYYVLVDQYKCYIEVYERLKDSWNYKIYDHLDDTIGFTQLDLKVPISEIYRRVKFT
ncbi:MAG TPA: Uma2 family endonuclease [Microscillaceae bacterium]|nr:Uma2 family endonuclease [Microscillaceae bacterium]